MPLNKSCSVSALRDNISKLVSEGFPQDQALAAALETLRKSCKQAGKPLPDMGEIVPPDFSDDIYVVFEADAPPDSRGLSRWSESHFGQTGMTFDMSIGISRRILPPCG